MGGTDSPPPSFVDSSQQSRFNKQCSPPESPIKTISVSPSLSSTSSSLSSTVSETAPVIVETQLSRKVSPIRYVPRSKSALNLQLKRDMVCQPRERSATVTHHESPYSPVQVYMDCITPQSLKCVLVGDSGVGKTAMLMSYTMEKFVTKHTPTIYDKFSTSLSVHGRRISVTLCDTSGSDDFGHLRPLCYPQADVALICFSVVNYSTLETARNKWAKEIRRHCPSVPIVLVGTHVDKREGGTLLRDFRTAAKGYVSRSEGQKVAAQMKAAYVECSSRTHSNVKLAFDEAIATALELSSSRRNSTAKCVKCTIL